MTEPCYRYRASLRRVVDGDTYILDVDLGFYVAVAIPVRLRGADTPERGEPGYDEATNRALGLLRTSSVVIESYKTSTGTPVQSFARWVCDVYVGGESLAEKLIAEGLAVPA